MKKLEIDSEKYIEELEEKIVELSLKLKSKNNELSSVYQSNKKFIGKLTHNLKNPVGIIFSFSEMILEDVEDYSPEKLEKYLTVIKNSADFSIMLLNNFAKFSRLQLPDLAFNFKKLNYIELVNSIINEHCSRATEKRTIVKEIDTNEVFLELDEEEIKQALNNILNNAFRYSSENTTITIKITETPKTIETEIIDEGIGISEEDLPNVLNEFFVVNTYSTNKQKCIGLGLSIANKIIQFHHGKIAVTSIINKGTSFKIILPKN